MKYELDIKSVYNDDIEYYQAKLILENYTEFGKEFDTKEAAYKDGEKRVCKALWRDFLNKHIDVLNIMKSDIEFSVIIANDPGFYHYFIRFNGNKFISMRYENKYDAYFDGAKKVKKLLNKKINK